MTGVISAEFYKIKCCKLLWCVLIYFLVLGFFASLSEFKVFGLYQGLEYFVLPTLEGVYLALGIAAMTGYLIGMDFSQKTIQNVLSIGVSRRAYYFSRMGVLMLLASILYIVAMLAYTVGRLCFYPAGEIRPQMEQFGVKLVVCVVISMLQLWAEVSIVNAICYFMKKQLPSMGFGMGLLYLEMVLRQIADMYGVVLARNIFDFSPIKVLRNTFEGYAMYDRICTFGFLKFGISAVVIITVSSGVGYMKFRHDSVGK